MSRTKKSYWTVLAVSVIVLISQQILAGTKSSSGIYSCDCIGRVGNVNCDYLDKVDITDLTFLIDHLFISRTRLPNREEANVDGDSNGEINVADITFLIDHLFISLAAVPECPKPYNTPPRTHIIDFDPNRDYINSLIPNLQSTGVRLSWRAEDIADFPHITPSFEFEWRVYGPYFDDSTVTTVWDTIWNQYVNAVFVLTTGEVLPFGEGQTFVICDTVPVSFGIDSVVLVITCDTVFVDTVQTSNVYGTIDTLFNVSDPAFMFSEANRVSLSSWNGANGWVADTRDSLYNLFRFDPADTTRVANFIFWVRARDPVDSLVLDPTPAFSKFKVFDPKFERDVAVIDFQTAFTINGIKTDSGRTYWQQAIDNWRPEAGYEDSRDFWRVTQPQGNLLPLKRLLSYKVAVLLNDDTKIGLLSPFYNRILTAQLAGVSVWLMMRNPLTGGEASQPQFGNIVIPPSYPVQFGVIDMVYSGWDWYIRVHSPSLRIDDFIGATSTQPQLWPDLVIDTSRLHSRYKWNTLPWVDSLGALPEVNYVVPLSGAEVLYTYNSLYGPNHFLGEQYNFHDRPVAIRWEIPQFRSAHWLFTPYAFDETAIQPAIDSMLNWLMEPWLSAEGQ